MCDSGCAVCLCLSVCVGLLSVWYGLCWVCAVGPRFVWAVCCVLRRGLCWLVVLVVYCGLCFALWLCCAVGDVCRQCRVRVCWGLGVALPCCV